MDLYKEMGDQVNWHQRRLVLFFGSEVLPKVELVARNHAIHGIEFIVWILHKSTIEHNVSTLMSVLDSPVLLLAGSAAVSYEITAQTSTHWVKAARSSIGPTASKPYVTRPAPV